MGERFNRGSAGKKILWQHFIHLSCFCYSYWDFLSHQRWIRRIDCYPLRSLVSFTPQTPLDKAMISFYIPLMFFLWNVFLCFCRFCFHSSPSNERLFLHQIPRASKILIFKRPQNQFIFLWFLCFSFLFHFHRCFCYFIFHDPFNCKTETTKYKKLPKFSWSSRSSVSCLSLFMAQMREESRKIFILLFVSYVLCWSISYWKKICVRWLINQNSSLFSLFDVKCTV